MLDKIKMNDLVIEALIQFDELNDELIVIRQIRQLFLPSKFPVIQY